MKGNDVLMLISFFAKTLPLCAFAVGFEGKYDCPDGLSERFSEKAFNPRVKRIGHIEAQPWRRLHLRPEDVARRKHDASACCLRGELRGVADAGSFGPDEHAAGRFGVRGEPAGAGPRTGSSSLDHRQTRIRPA